MPDRSTPLTKARARANRRLPCSLCRRRRRFTSQFCDAHSNASRLYGHPHGRLIRKRVILPYRVRVRKFFNMHRQHVAYVAALKFMATVLQPGPDEPRRKGHTASGLSAEWLLWRELVRLADARAASGLPKVPAKDALEVVAALWLFSHHDARALPDDARLTYAIGQSLFRLAPLRSIRYYDHAQRRMVTHDTKAPAGIAARLIGERIRTKLGRFLLNLTNAIGATRAEGALTP